MAAEDLNDPGIAASPTDQSAAVPKIKSCESSSSHTITLQPGTAPLRPFAELLAPDEVRWIDGYGALETTMAAGCVTARDEVLPDFA